MATYIFGAVDNDPAITRYHNAAPLSPPNIHPGCQLNLKQFLEKEQAVERARLETLRGGNSTTIDESFLSPGPEFEELNVDLRGQRLPAKLLAYYLTQFHPIPENDEWWGAGFTEWRNVTRARPRYRGQHQPHLPRDTGFYDLRLPDVMHQQRELAQRAGIYGWCFYYYRFSQQRLLEQPVNNFLNDPSIDMPFSLMWANETWTRRWSKKNRDEILIQQAYWMRDNEALVDDLARHFNDPRYIRIDGKPLFHMYRISNIILRNGFLDQWRELLFQRHGIEVDIHMVQTYNRVDPREYGVDSAIEFPPHNMPKLKWAKQRLADDIDPGFKGLIRPYLGAIEHSLSLTPPDFDLIRCLFPAWDSEARHTNAGYSFVGSTPARYQYWLSKLIQYAVEHPLRGESFVAINAWNEWAEGAHLEPDIHYGSAYLNATARALMQHNEEANPASALTQNTGMS